MPSKTRIAGAELLHGLGRLLSRNGEAQVESWQATARATPKLMKRSLLGLAIFALVTTTFPALAQQASPAPAVEGTTRLEQFLTKKSVLVIKEEPVLAHVVSGSGFLTAVAMRLYEPGKEKDALLGMRIDMSSVHQGDVEASLDASTFLDRDEVQGLMQAIDSMAKLRNQWTGKNRPYTEVSYRTKSGFAFGLMIDQGKVRVFAKARTHTMFFDAAKLGDLKNAVQQCAAALK